MLLVFGHLLATAMALGAIVATDLRMLSRLSQDRVRIPPPNGFVARLVTIGLVLLWATGAAIVWLGLQKNPAFLTPKIQGKLVLVVLLTLNAWVLHRVTFPRLARGRSVGRWRFADYAIVAVPVALSNCLWMFCAFLGIARPWNGTMSMDAVLVVAGGLYAATLVAVTLVLAAAGWQHPEGRIGRAVVAMKRWLGAIGSLGRDDAFAAPAASRSSARRSRASDRTMYVEMPLPASVVSLHAHRAARAARRSA